jgi:hypothetical protein
MTLTAAIMAALLLMATAPATYVGRVLSDPPPGLKSKTRPTYGGGAPELPRTTVDTSEPKLKGRTIHVPAGGRLQDAIDQAKPGDRVTLEAGSTYEGPFRLPKKDGDDWIVISPASMRGLPPADHRVAPRHAAAMPKLVADSRSVIVAERGAHHFRFIGVEIAPSEGMFLYALVELGDEGRDDAQTPHHIVFDRCYLHGDPRRGSRRGIAMNSRDTAVINSYLAEFKEVGADSQAIAGWNGPGPFKIANNYLEAAGENVMFGGADPSIAGLVPADIEVLRNHMAKPLRWKKGGPGFDGTEWTVKNLFELKNARRVLIEGNLLEYNWPQAQNGFAILFTVRNQDGGAPWSTVEDVVFRNNVVRHVAAGFNILGRDDNHRSGPTRRILIRNNLLVDVGGEWGGNGRLFQLLDGTADVVIDHNTASQTGGIVFGGDHAPHSNFIFQNNVMPDRGAGFVGSGTGAGIAARERYFPDSIVRRNLFIGGKSGDYPPDNFFPPSLEDFSSAAPKLRESGKAGTTTRIAGERYRLIPPKRYAGIATDGRTPGADIDALLRAMIEVICES